jgi:hypothetical protein
MLHSFRKQSPQSEVVIHVSRGKPENLLRSLSRGELDVAWVWCRPGFEPDGTVESVDLDLELLCSWKSDPCDGNFKWNQLSRHTVVLLERIRYPMPEVPEDRIPPDASIVRVESFTEAVALAMGGGKAATFALPALLTGEELLKLRPVRVPKLKPMRLCLVRSKEAAGWHTAEVRNALDGIVEVFVGGVQEMRGMRAATADQEGFPHDATGREGYLAGRRLPFEVRARISHGRVRGLLPVRSGVICTSGTRDFRRGLVSSVLFGHGAGS